MKGIIRKSAIAGIFIAIMAVSHAGVSQTIGLEEQVPETSGLQELNDLSVELAGLWPEKSCGHFVTRESGYPLVSLACSGSFTDADRSKFLDALFTKGFVLENQEYSPGEKSGHYLFKTRNSRKGDLAVFFKLHFRDAGFLWPDNPEGQYSVAIYIDEVCCMKELYRWQSLGVTLNYGINPFKKESQTLVKRIKEYRREAWLSLPLEPRKLSPYMTHVFNPTISDV